MEQSIIEYVRPFVSYSRLVRFTLLLDEKEFLEISHAWSSGFDAVVHTLHIVWFVRVRTTEGAPHLFRRF